MITDWQRMIAMNEKESHSRIFYEFFVHFIILLCAVCYPLRATRFFCKATVADAVSMSTLFYYAIFLLFLLLVTFGLKSMQQKNCIFYHHVTQTLYRVLQIQVLKLSSSKEELAFLLFTQFQLNFNFKASSSSKAQMELLDKSAPF